jgi:hypothetical protein
MNALKKAALWTAMLLFTGCENSFLRMRNPYATGGLDDLPVHTGPNALPVHTGPDVLPVFLSAGSAAEWDAALNSIQGSTGTSFALLVTADISLSPQDLTVSAYRNKNIVVKGDTPSRTISLASTGSLFTVGEDLTVELRDITAQGQANNTAPLVTVNANGKLALKTGGKITGNTYITISDRKGGGGVFVNGGTLEITGGEVSGNTATATAGKSNGFVVLGGGILVDNGGVLVMSGGSVKNNTLSYSDSGDSHAWGGGLALYNGSNFTLSSGSIEGNNITVSSISQAASASGGGIYAENSSFTMTGGIIRNNTAVSSSANEWGAAGGGGMRINNSGSFTMQGGEIYGNACTYNRLNSGAPAGNDMCGAYGGGVNILLATMRKTGGVIYGEDAAGSDGAGIPYRNLAQDSGGPVADGGQAVVYFANTTKTAWRDTSAYAGDGLDTADPPGSGGWE